MKFRTLAAAPAAASLAVAPAVAAERTAAPIEGESEMGRGSDRDRGSGVIVGILALAAIIAAIIIAFDDGDDDPGSPLSP